MLRNLCQVAVGHLNNDLLSSSCIPAYYTYFGYLVHLGSLSIRQDFDWLTEGHLISFMI